MTPCQGKGTKKTHIVSGKALGVKEGALPPEPDTTWVLICARYNNTNKPSRQGVQNPKSIYKNQKNNPGIRDYLTDSMIFVNTLGCASAICERTLRSRAIVFFFKAPMNLL